MKIIGICIVGPNEGKRHLKKTLDTFKRLTDNTLIVFNYADPDTRKLVMKYNFPQYDDEREWGMMQNRMKEDAILRVQKIYKPDWILFLDADEELLCTREQLERLTDVRDENGNSEIAWYFWFIQKWNDEEHHMPTMGLWDVRFFKVDYRLGVKFQNSPLHCGMAPKWAYTYGFYAPYLVIHRGLESPEDRARKSERYKIYDPKMKYCSPLYYESLKSKDNGVPYDEKTEKEKVASEVARYGRRTIPQIRIPIMGKQYRVERLVDGAIFIIDEKHLWDTVNQGGLNTTFKNLGEVGVINDFLPPEEAPIVNPLACVLCDFVAKSKLGLSAHVRARHEKNPEK